MTLSPRPLRRRLAAVTALTTLAGLTATGLGTTGSAYAVEPLPRAPFLPTAATPAPPTLTPADGSFVEGTVTVSSEAVAASDDVTALTVDGNRIAAAETLGSSQLSFDVGDNSIETRFGNYVLVNGDHRIDLTDAVNERVTLPVPNSELVTGDNTVEIFTGAIDSSCGLNNDDFAVSEVRLELLGETADGEDNDFTYSMGDGSCGTNTSLLTHATLHFFVQGTPGDTTGLEAELDTRTLSNGRHRIAATTAAGKTTSHVVRVNNAPVGAPRISPVDGTLVSGKQTITAANTVTGGGAAIDNLLIDGAVPPAATTLAGGTAAFRFTVGTNSIEARYFNYLEVNGHHIDIGGDWVSQAVSIPVPRHYLVNGENTVRVVTGDINSGSGATLCANRDDFSLSAISMTVEGGTVTPVGNASTYAMGDGTCGSSATALPEATLTFNVSGAPTSRTLSTLGSGDANLSMYIGGNGTEARYNNYVLVNGNQLFLGDYVGVTASLTIPNEWLIPGVNVVEIVGGYFTTSCGANMDDYPVSEVSLTPASGTATLTHKSTNVSGAAVAIQIGDGSCGSSFTGTGRVGLTFAVDAPAQGLRSDVETAMLPDGEHTVSATSAGVTATRTLVTDNTAPLLASSVPATGQRITSAVAFDVQLNDLAGVAGTPTTTLDGQPIALGAPVGPGLIAGPHVIAVTATDALGNTATREISFTSAGIPDVPAALSPASGTTGLGRTVDLEAQVAVPGGGDVTATFTEAAVVVPETAFQGLSTKVPTTLQVAGEEEVDASSLTPLGDETLASKAGRDVTFQRFDLDVTADGEAQEGANPVLRWTGTVDPERIVALRAWNSDTRAWDVLSSSRGALEDDTVLTVTAPARYVDRGTVHVMVTGEDPFADDIDPGSQDGFADPSDYDFSLVHFTDTQYLAEGAVEQETEAERAIWKAAYGATTEWIAQHKTSSKIAYVAHTGDITENNIDAPTTPEMQAQVTGEFEVTSELQATLDRAGVVNQVIAGNHDNQRGREEGPDAIYNDYYGPERYQAADDQWGTTASYGGPWKEGDNQNNYVLFSAGGLEFVAVGLSYGVTREEADWATSIFQRYPERNGIVLSHDYLKPSPNRDGRGSGFSVPDGSLLYKLVVEANPNVFLVLAGHEHGVGTNIKTGVGATVTHDVVELLADYQAYTVSADELGLTEIGGYAPTDQLRFGASFLRMLQFDVDRGEMIVDTYSPFLDNFGAVEYDPDARYDEDADNMVLPVDLTSRKTQFTTDDIAAFVPVATVGSETVASGTTATTTWSGLAPRTTYGWVATSTSPGGGRAVAEPGVFRTGPAPASVVSATDTSVAHGAVASVPVSVTPADSSDVANGEVTLSEGGTVLATAPVTAGTATVPVPASLAPGAHTLVASYAGSGWIGDGTDELVLTVGKGTSGVTATSPAVTVGEVPVVTATVTGVAGAAPTGSVRVLEGGTELGTAALVDGVARVSLPATLSAGEHPLTVDYVGNDQLTASTATTSLTVAKASSGVTAVSPAVTSGEVPVVTATVTGAAGAAPTGTVQVREGATVLGTGSLVDGVARVELPTSLSVGEHALTVDYVGNDQLAASTTATTLTVKAKAKAASTTTVRANPATVKRGKFVTLTVTVRSPEGIPAGRVTVMRDGRQRGAATLASGRATIRMKVTDLAGRRTFNVRYLGSGTVLPSIAQVKVRVLKP